jgi:hypothetical protein
MIKLLKYQLLPIRRFEHRFRCSYPGNDMTSDDALKSAVRVQEDGLDATFNVGTTRAQFSSDKYPWS